MQIKIMSIMGFLVWFKTTADRIDNEETWYNASYSLTSQQLAKQVSFSLQTTAVHC